MAFTVTATQNGNVNNGTTLQVKVLTGAIEVGGASATSANISTSPDDTSVTPNATNSLICFGLVNCTGANAFTLASNNTAWDNNVDATSGYTGLAGFYSGAVSGGTPVTVGATLPTGQNTGYAIYEVEPSSGSTPAVDASSPAGVNSTTSSAVTAAFTPPGGSVLVAIVAANGTGGAGNTDIVMSDTSGMHLTWTKRAGLTGASNGGVWVFTAFVPGILAPSPVPWITPLSSRFGPAIPFAQPNLLISPPAAAAAAPFVPQPQQPPVPQRPGPHRGRLGKLGACAAGILAVTTLSPQPSAVPPSRPQPVIAHPAPHRAAVKGRLAPPQLPFTTAKLPPTAISPRPPHRASWQQLPAKTTLSPQPSIVFPMPQPVPVRRPGPHRVLWKGIAGPAPAVVVATPAAPSRPQPTVNRPPAPHRAIWRAASAPAQPSYLTAKLPPTAVARTRPHRAFAGGILAKTTLSAQPSSVPPPQWRQPSAPRPPHRGTWRVIAGPPPPVVVVAAVPPARPQPTVNRPPAPHRGTGKGILAVTTLSPQPSFVPAPHWQAQPRNRPAHRAVTRVLAASPAPLSPPARPQPTVNRPPAPHRVIWRVITAPAPAVVVVTGVPPSRPQPPVYRPIPQHRAIVRIVAGPAPPPVTPGVAAPAKPAPVTNRPPAPHRAVTRRILGTAPLSYLTAKLPPTAVAKAAPHRAVSRWLAAKTTLSAQPARVPAPHYPPVIQHLPPHRATWRQQVISNTGIGIEPGGGFTVVTDPRDGTHAVTGNPPGAGVTDPRDALHAVAGAVPGAGVTDPRDAPHTVS